MPKADTRACIAGHVNVVCTITARGLVLTLPPMRFARKTRG